MACWLRLSVVFVFTSLIADTWANGSPPVKLVIFFFCRGRAYHNSLLLELLECCLGIALWPWLSASHPNLVQTLLLLVHIYIFTLNEWRGLINSPFWIFWRFFILFYFFYVYRLTQKIRLWPRLISRILLLPNMFWSIVLDKKYPLGLLATTHIYTICYKFKGVKKSLCNITKAYPVSVTMRRVEMKLKLKSKSNL